VTSLSEKESHSQSVSLMDVVEDEKIAYHSRAGFYQDINER